jgi:hypothetical protein
MGLRARVVPGATPLRARFLVTCACLLVLGASAASGAGVTTGTAATGTTTSTTTNTTSTTKKHTASTKSIHGTVASVDATSKSITVHPKTGADVTVKANDKTTYWNGKAKGTWDDVKQGGLVSITYHNDGTDNWALKVKIAPDRAAGGGGSGGVTCPGTGTCPCSDGKTCAARCCSQ